MVYAQLVAVAVHNVGAYSRTKEGATDAYAIEIGEQRDNLFFFVYGTHLFHIWLYGCCTQLIAAGAVHYHIV